MQPNLRAAVPLINEIVDEMYDNGNPAIMSMDANTRSYTGRVCSYRGRDYFLCKVEGMRRYKLTPRDPNPAWCLSIEYDALTAIRTGVELLGISIDHGEDAFYRDMILLKIVA